MYHFNKLGKVTLEVYQFPGILSSNLKEPDNLPLPPPILWYLKIHYKIYTDTHI